MIRIAIVEDDVRYQKQLQRYLQRYMEESGEKIEIQTFNDGDEITEKYNRDYDIIFLDIEMKRLNGMDAAREIRKKDREVILIFITNMAQYAIQGYEVEAMDYVLKPIKYFAFSQEIDKAVSRLKKKRIKYLMVNQESKLLRLDIRRISYIESDGHNLLIHYDGEETYVIRETMKNMEQKMAEEPFVRCNSGYLVNLEYVKSVEKNSVYVGDTLLPISRPRKKEFMEKLTNYFGRQ